MNPVFQQLKVRERIVVCRKELYERKARKILHLMDLSITDIDGKLIDLCQWKDSKPEQKRHGMSRATFWFLARTVFTVFSKVVTFPEAGSGGTGLGGTYKT